MKNRPLKETLYGHVSKVAKAIANSHRLELLDLLANGPKSVENIARETNLSVANASQHLQVLRNAGLAKSNRSGNFIFYELADDHTLQALNMLRSLTAERIPELKSTLASFRREMGSEESVTLKEVSAREDIYLLDVRPEEEFIEGHLPNAHSLPIAELRSRWEELPRDRIIAIYCRGPFCFYADEAVQFLKRKGLTVIRLEVNPLDFI